MLVAGSIYIDVYVKEVKHLGTNEKTRDFLKNRNIFFKLPVLVLGGKPCQKSKQLNIN